jgi:hypothetical protein
MSEKQLAALKEGRAKLAEKRRLLKLQKEQQEKEARDLEDKYNSESDDEHGYVGGAFCTIL